MAWEQRASLAFCGIFQADCFLGLLKSRFYSTCQRVLKFGQCPDIDNVTVPNKVDRFAAFYKSLSKVANLEGYCNPLLREKD